MSSKHPPLTSRDVKRGLTKLGFAFRNQKGSHEQWVKIVDGRIFKVTVDCPKEPFTHDLIKSMASQAGVSKKDFYAACND
ncbi:MAG: addiction module toxin, HicA family [Geobacter sp.]|nr:MAG: addiction module toxin, HicA family [Geobacter sp.]